MAKLLSKNVQILDIFGTSWLWIVGTTVICTLKTCYASFFNTSATHNFKRCQYSKGPWYKMETLDQQLPTSCSSRIIRAGASTDNHYMPMASKKLVLLCIRMQCCHLRKMLNIFSKLENHQKWFHVKCKRYQTFYTENKYRSSNMFCGSNFPWNHFWCLWRG